MCECKIKYRGLVAYFTKKQNIQTKKKNDKQNKHIQNKYNITGNCIPSPKPKPNRTPSYAPFLLYRHHRSIYFISNQGISYICFGILFLALIVFCSYVCCICVCVCVLLASMTYTKMKNKMFEFFL